MSDGEIKVTDKRMFTQEGELREEYRHLGEARSRPEPEESEPKAAPPRPAEPPPREPREPAPQEPREPVAPRPPSGESPPLEIPGEPALGGKPGLMDLLGVLAEPAAIYLGDAQLPDGRSAEDLQAARFYIDLLDVVRQKTAGNLDAQESAMLEDLLYRLRLRYVQKRG